MAVTANKLGRYELRREIARSNDVVYEAWDPAVGRRVALKEMVMLPGMGHTAGEERIKRFYREARAAGGLSHPNIVTVYEVGEDAGRHFIAMEYLDGPTLREALQGGQPFPLDRAVLIAAQIADALQYAHEHGVIHRDVKPDNVHLLAPTTPKLTDFGIARIEAETNITLSGQVFGTPSYMSPEQVAGGDIDARTDVFSLGVMLFEMVAGRKPFTGESVVTITYNIVNETPVIPPAVPEWLAAVILKALQKRPEDRYAGVGQMADDLRTQRAPGAPAYAAPNTGAWSPQTGGTTYMPAPAPTPLVFAPRRKPIQWPKLPRLSAESRVFAGALLATLVVGLLIAWGIWASSLQFRRDRREAALASVDAIRGPAVQAFNSGNYARAVDGFRRVYSATRDEADRENLVHGWIGWGLTQSGPEAQQALGQALRLDPGNPVANFAMADLYHRSGDMAGALSYSDAAQSAMNERPSEVTQALRSRLAALYLSLGDAARQSGAIGSRSDQDLWRTAERIDPIGPVGDAARQRLSGGR